MNKKKIKKIRKEEKIYSISTHRTLDANEAVLKPAPVAEYTWGVELALLVLVGVLVWWRDDARADDEEDQLRIGRHNVLDELLLLLVVDVVVVGVLIVETLGVLLLLLLEVQSDKRRSGGV